MFNKNKVVEESFTPVTKEELQELNRKYLEDVEKKYLGLDKFINEEIRKRTANGYANYEYDFYHHPFVNFMSKRFEEFVKSYQDRGFNVSVNRALGIIELKWYHLL